MINQTVARRYAQAIFEIAKEKGAAAKFAADLSALIGTMEGHPQLRQVLQNRLISPGEKQELVKELFTPEIDPMVANFINLVFEKSREEYLGAILDAFNGLVDKDKKILQAQVRVASALSSEQQSRLEAKLSLITGQQIRTTVQVDPSLIGGMSVKIGDIVYDGSIVKQLGTLKKHLQQGQLGR